MSTIGRGVELASDRGVSQGKLPHELDSAAEDASTIKGRGPTTKVTSDMVSPCTKHRKDKQDH